MEDYLPRAHISMTDEDIEGLVQRKEKIAEKIINIGIYDGRHCETKQLREGYFSWRWPNRRSRDRNRKRGIDAVSGKSRDTPIFQGSWVPRGYLLKIKSYKEQITEAKNQTTTVEELDHLQNNLENKEGISGYIVDSKKKKLKKFHLGSSPLSCETSNKLWKMIDSWAWYSFTWKFNLDLSYWSVWSRKWQRWWLLAVFRRCNQSRIARRLKISAIFPSRSIIRKRMHFFTSPTLKRRQQKNPNEPKRAPSAFFVSWRSSGIIHRTISRG